MVMPLPLDFHTREMVLALPDDGKRYETVHGELLVTPAPRLRHQRILMRLISRLEPWVRRHGVGEVLLSPADISWGPDILVQPDLFVAAPQHAGARDWPEVQHLLLVAEVLSPTTARADRFSKRRLYQEQGVRTYWILDPELVQVEVWTPEDTFPTIEREVVAWLPEGATAPLEINLTELFGE